MTSGECDIVKLIEEWKLKMWWPLSVVALVCLSLNVEAATLSEADAIATAKKHCAKQAANGPRLKWSASLVDGAWAVGGLPQEGQELKGWLYVIPTKGPLPERCEPYAVYRAFGVQP
jgi:hypothetical protein